MAGGDNQQQPLIDRIAPSITGDACNPRRISSRTTTASPMPCTPQLTDYPMSGRW